MRILFQGDSITDVGRDKDSFSDLGNGYVKWIAEDLAASENNRNMECLNRGISGHRVLELQGRWKKDCIDLKPDVLSILIGINDVWRRYDSNDPTTLEAFESGYMDILTSYRSLTDGKLMILEPFLLHTTEERAAWREDLDPKRKVVAKLAAEFNAVYIPLDSIFAAASEDQLPSYWAADGVHPSEAGHKLIAEAWIKKFKEFGYDQ